jgi:tetratricopeptide (TPR) repeat protein
MVAQEPKDPERAYSRAFLIVGYWPPPDAARAAASFANCFPEDPYRHILNAKLMERLGRFAESFAAYEAHMSEIAPEDENVAAAARLLAKMERHAEADEMLKRSTGPSAAAAYFDVHPRQTASEVEFMGESLRKSGLPELTVLATQINALYVTNHLREAKAMLRTYLERDSTNEWANLTLGQAQDRLGERREARRRVEAVFQNNRRNVTACKFLVGSYLRGLNVIMAGSVILLCFIANIKRP